MSDEKRVEQDNNSRTIYQELCNSYRAIDDFRAKLLGFLPLATGTGIFLLLDNAMFKDGQGLDYETRILLVAAGAFGFAITLGLFCYEVYGIKKCHALIKAGRDLEVERLSIGKGQFEKRPREVARLINEPFAAGVIYPAVLAAWTFLAAVFMPEDVPWWAPHDQDALWWAIGVFIVGFVVSFYFNLKLKNEKDIREVLGITEEKKDDLTIDDVWAYLKIKARSKKSRRKKPNISQSLVELLNVISPDLQMEPRDRNIMNKLKDRMNQLGLENRNPSKQDWQDLGQLAEGLRQAHANNQ
jgi:hypothetical protein